MNSATLPRTPPRIGPVSPITFDLRSRRDVQSRRMGRVVLRRYIRVGALLVLDSVCIALGVWGAAWFNGAESLTALLPLLLALGVLGQVAMRTYGAAEDRRSLEKLAAGLLLAIGLTTILGEIYVSSIARPRDYLVIAAVAGSFLCIWRAGADWMVRRIYNRGIGRERMLVIGRREDEWEVREHYRIAGDAGVELMGYVSPTLSGDPTALGDLEVLGDLLVRHEIDRVVISARLDPAELRQTVRECFLHGAAVSVVPATLNELACKVSTKSVLGWPMLELGVPRFHLMQVILKRTVDVLAAGLGLLLLAPLFLSLAVAIKLDTAGSVFFRQRRLGVGGRPFNIIKFRSMRSDAEQVLSEDPELFRRYIENGFKLHPDEDPRVSRFGAFLRRSSLDELPQLLNVLMGDMSLVGPRPIVPDEIKQYGSHAPTFLGVKPGVTGYWQVSGRSGVGYPERAELDINYITGWSLALDIKILLRTLPAVLRREGAH